MAGRVPPAVRRAAVLLVVAGLVAGAFAGVVLPLFHVGSAGPPQAEISGIVPDRIPRNRLAELEVAIDNIGVASISPVCIRARFDPTIEVDDAIFQGLDRVPFRDGRACGGRLNSQETINVRLSIHATTPGRVSVHLAPADGSRAIGPELRGTMAVGP